MRMISMITCHLQTTNIHIMKKEEARTFFPCFVENQLVPTLKKSFSTLTVSFAKGNSISTIITNSSVTVNHINISFDNHYLAYTVDTSGEEVYNLYIKDLNTGKIEVIKRNVYSFVFGMKSSPYPEIYYTVANNLMRTNHMYIIPK